MIFQFISVSWLAISACFLVMMTWDSESRNQKVESLKKHVYSVHWRWWKSKKEITHIYRNVHRGTFWDWLGHALELWRRPLIGWSYIELYDILLDFRFFEIFRPLFRVLTEHELEVHREQQFRYCLTQISFSELIMTTGIQCLLFVISNKWFTG